MSKSTYEELKEEFYKKRKASKSSNYALESYNNGHADDDYDDDDVDCICD